MVEHASALRADQRHAPVQLFCELVDERTRAETVREPVRISGEDGGEVEVAAKRGPVLVVHVELNVRTRLDSVLGVVACGVVELLRNGQKNEAGTMGQGNMH